MCREPADFQHFTTHNNTPQLNSITSHNSIPSYSTFLYLFHSYTPFPQNTLRPLCHLFPYFTSALTTLFHLVLHFDSHSELHMYSHIKTSPLYIYNSLHSKPHIPQHLTPYSTPIHSLLRSTHPTSLHSRWV